MHIRDSYIANYLDLFKYWNENATINMYDREDDKH